MKKLRIGKYGRVLAVTALVAALAFSVSGTASAASAFADVPLGHWAYDSVAYLSASGVLSGYPDGAFKGDRPATRYELASCAARALAQTDAAKADEETVRQLKNLCTEFADELNTMGADLSQLNMRTAELEENLGGWSITGSLTFDMNWGDSDSARHTSDKGRNWNRFADSNVYVTKTLEDGSYVGVRFALDKSGKPGKDEDIVLDRIYWQGLIGNAGITIGRFDYDWEADAGLYCQGENDGWFNHFVADGFRGDIWLGSRVRAEAVVGRNLDSGQYPAANFDYADAALYALKLDYYLSERVYLGAMGAMIRDDSGKDDASRIGDSDTYGGWLSWEFVPNASLRGLYYHQDTKDSGAGDQEAWKAILEVDRPLLRVTSLWAEYGKIDRDFVGTQANAYNWSDGNGSAILRPGLADADMLLIRADQQWKADGGKWGSFLRYAQSDYDIGGADTITDWTVGITYRPSPSVGFQLAYDEIDYGNLSGTFLGEGASDTKDRLVRLRTTISF